jgi:hypothetical protein
MKKLHPEDRRVLLKIKKLDPIRKSEPQRRHLKRSQSSSSTYNRLVQRRRLTEEKLRLKKEEQDKEEMRGCTFKPKIN